MTIFGIVARETGFILDEVEEEEGIWQKFNLEPMNQAHFGDYRRDEKNNI